MLLIGLLVAMASVGTPRGHNLHPGTPLGLGGTADKWMLSLEPFSSLRAESTSSRLRLAVGSAYALSLTARFRRGSYTSPCFHIDSTVAAIFRARVSLARFGLIPAASIRS